MSKSLTIRVPLPAPSSILAANMLGVAGLLAVVLAVGGLAGVWWGLLTAGLVAVGVSYVAQTHAASGAAPVAAPTPLRKAGA